MTQAEQINLTHAIVDNIRDGIVDQIKEGRVPAEWNGFELRELIANKAIDTCRLRKYKKTRNSEYRKRAAEFENTIIVQNL